MRYAPRLIAAGSAPKDALVEPLIVDPPASPLGEHRLIPEVAWMIERDDAFVHVLAAEADDRETMRGFAMVTMLDGTLANETLDQLPGIALATTGEYAAELLLDADHLNELHRILGGKVYLAGTPRHGRLLVGGVGGGIDGMRAFVEHVRREHDAAVPGDRISPIAMLVRDGAPKAVVGELQLGALASAQMSRSS